MANPSEYIMHIWEATVSPEDHSGQGVWTPKKKILVNGTQVNNSYGHGGVSITRPSGLSSLTGGVHEIGGKNYKCAATSFQCAEHDEQETVTKAFAGFSTADIMLLVRGWSDGDNIRNNVETFVYWGKVMNPEYLQFGIFAAGQIETTDKRGVAPAATVDLSKGQARMLQTPNGRTAKLKSDILKIDTLGDASPQQVNTQLLDI